MSAHLRTYRVALDDAGACAIWVTAESRQAACELAESMLAQSRSALPWPDSSIKRIKVLDEYEEDIAA
jgi:hypothetical protein